MKSAMGRTNTTEVVPGLPDLPRISQLALPIVVQHSTQVIEKLNCIVEHQQYDCHTLQPRDMMEKINGPNSQPTYIME